MSSFHPVKPITTDEGGIIMTNSEVFYEKLKLFRSHGISKTPFAVRQGDWYYEMTELWFNYRMSDIQEALGLSQMGKIDGFIERRREIAALYNEKLADVPDLILPEKLSETDSGYEQGLCPIAENWYEQALRLPMFPGMTDGDIGDMLSRR